MLNTNQTTYTHLPFSWIEEWETLAALYVHRKRLCDNDSLFNNI